MSRARVGTQKSCFPTQCACVSLPVFVFQFFLMAFHYCFWVSCPSTGRIQDHSHLPFPSFTLSTVCKLLPSSSPNPQPRSIILAFHSCSLLIWIRSATQGFLWWETSQPGPLPMGSQRRGPGEQGTFPIKLASCDLQSLILTWKRFWSAFRRLASSFQPTPVLGLAPFPSSALGAFQSASCDGSWEGEASGRSFIFIFQLPFCQREVLTPGPCLEA